MAVQDPVERRRAALPFLVLGSAAVVLGGLVAAVTGPLRLAHGSWLAAFLVLVLGVAQIVLGAGGAYLPSAPGGGRGGAVTALAAWNAGNLLVVAGTFAGAVWLVALGSVLVLVALAAFAWAVGMPRGSRRGRAAAYQVFVVLLAVSVAIGMVLSVARHS